MERFDDLSIVLKSYPFQERDKVVVAFTENHGKISAVAKGAVSSKRYAGSLNFLSCSKVAYVSKINSELARIDSATIHYEFRKLSQDIRNFSAACFVAEFYLKLFELNQPSRDFFVLLSNTLFALDEGKPCLGILNAFLSKTFQLMGYPPSFLRCVQCSKGAHEIESIDGERFYWLSQAGGMICAYCMDGRSKLAISEELLLYFQFLVTKPFKELSPYFLEPKDALLFKLLVDFLHHHIPGVDHQNLKSLKTLQSVI